MLCLVNDVLCWCMNGELVLQVLVSVFSYPVGIVSGGIEDIFCLK